MVGKKYNTGTTSQWERHGQTVAVAIAVLAVGGRVLVTRRAPGAHLGGLWEFPGGKLESGEAPQAALVRELREELGIGCRVLARWRPLRHRYGERRVVLYPFLCVPVGGRPRPLAATRMRWVAAGALGGLRFPAASRPLLRRLAARRLE
ncbi:MAG: (deoxy)nucleoside triphosphate pyrophosphohydrolase [Nitrospirae bacterium]|nr:(deoxy)nucleoside triphosphate pyrophosphohydrolase [Nitrospirota bacterium]